MRILLLLAALAAAYAAPADKKRMVKTHQAVDASIECAACHDKVAETWDKGRHGIAQVRCAACHGTPASGFTAKPAATACRTCHPAQADSVDKACISCHPPHALTPHAAKQKGGH